MTLLRTWTCLLVAASAGVVSAAEWESAVVAAANPGEWEVEAPLARLAGRHLSAAAGVGPVDVVYPRDMLAQGYTTLPQVLAAVLPSFTYPEPALADGTDHARPGSLRGLAPNQHVVLLNGKRRNPAAWLHVEDTYGRGTLGYDLSVIPLAAIERIEVLRDGASARYGSGAIAGVINIVTRQATSGGSLMATFGQYRTHMGDVPDLSEVGVSSPSEFFLFERGDINTDDGEGDTLTLSANGGFTLFDDGFLDLTAEYREQQPTNRSGFDPRALYPPLPNGNFDPREVLTDRRTQRYGNPRQEDVKLLANFGLPVGERTSFYGHMGYTARNAESVDQFVTSGSIANVASIFPDGYRPLLESDDESRYYTLGFRGEHWRWAWDFSYTQDEHEMDFTLRETLNPSLGEISPTTFEIGNYEGRHATVALDLARDFAIGSHGPLALSWGLELRVAEHENEFGERASFVAEGATDSAGNLRPPGAQGLFGIRTLDIYDDSRVTIGGYLEAQLPLGERLSLLVGTRYDDEEELSEVAGRLALRWRATDSLGVRAAVSRDYRMPSPAQSFYLRAEQIVAGPSYVEQGTFPADDPRALALGAEPLEAETSLNVSGGLRWQPTDSAWLDVNVYQIEVDDQIVLTSLLSGPVVEALLDAAGAPNTVAVSYFFNGVDLRTRGVDVSVGYQWRGIELWGAFNANDTTVQGAAVPPVQLAGGPERFGGQLQSQLESSTPRTKLHLGARWSGERLAVEALLSHYGEVVDVGVTPAEDLDLGQPWVLDLHARYRLTPRSFVGFGVHNFLDAYPDTRPRDTVANRMFPYSNYSPYGFNGRFVYLRAGLDFPP